MSPHLNIGLYTYQFAVTLAPLVVTANEDKRQQNAEALIEVALPLKESPSSRAREKSIRHGHISTLHIWWARRPLAACRAVVFASLIPDPNDPECPESFRKLVSELLSRSEFKPRNGDGSTVEDTTTEPLP